MLQAERLEYLKNHIVSEIEEYSIILIDLDGNILTWNKGAEKIKGYKASEILGQNISIFYLPQDRITGMPRKWLDRAKNEGSVKITGRRVRKDGVIFSGSIIITAIHDDHNNVVGYTKMASELGNQN
jgi:PAS domain S-box-containing protein